MTCLNQLELLLEQKTKQMKKQLQFIIALLFVSNLSAQTTIKGFELGVQVAMNLSYIQGLTFYEDSETNSVARPGIFLFGTKDLSDEFYIKPGIGLNFKGGEVVSNDIFEGEGYNDIDRYKMSFLEIPVMVGYKASDKISLETGLSLGLTLSSVDDYETTYTDFEGNSDTESGSEDLSDVIKGQELGFHIGAKYLISSKFSGGIRYFSGSDLNKTQLFTKINLKGFAFFVEMKI